MRSYNRMVQQVSTLVNQVYYAELKNHQNQIELQQRQLESQTIEFQALQSQIKPQFLYNTLETVNAYAIIKEVDEISEMVEALAYMFRYSAQNQKLVAFVNELKHVGKYLLIQEYRLQKAILFDTGRRS